jgi:hypothetical protein
MPSRLVICRRSIAAGDNIPLLACLRFGWQNISMSSKPSFLAFSRVRHVLRLILSLERVEEALATAWL